jgi:phosphoribosylamine--glycine ligase
MLETNQFGEAGHTVVIEAFLQGEEISVMAVTDGRELELLPTAQDHKRLMERDRGPNTGGMGAYSPVALASPALQEKIRRDVLLPALEQMHRLGTPFSGVLYAGLMIDDAGVPWVIEFNCRLGDPEAQVVLPLIAEGLTESLWRVARRESPSRINVRRGAAVTTVLASQGYPDRSEKGAPIIIPSELPDGVTIFHAGTSRGPDGALRVDGGRVLAATALSTSFTEAQRLSREAAEAVQFEGKVFRRDIGWRESARLEQRGCHV